MISSNTRASRSRYSSPAQPPQNGNWSSRSTAGSGVDSLQPASASDASRALMHKWLEPSVQSKSSFEEAGLMRYGVLENMAPLGTMPKPKKPEHHPVRRIVLRAPGVNAANNANSERASTPSASAAAAATPPAKISAPRVVTPPPPSSAPPPRKALPTRAGGGGGAVHTGDQDKELGSPGVSRRIRARRASAAATPSAPASLPKKARRPSSAGVQKRSISTTAPKATPFRFAARAHRSESEDRDLIDKVVQEAVDEALRLCRYPTAYALKTLYEEKAGDAEFCSMVEDVFHQTADVATAGKFQSMIAERKREGKKNGLGCDDFVRPTRSLRLSPQPAPCGALLHPPPQGDEEAPRASKKIKISHAAMSTKTTTPPRKNANCVSARDERRPLRGPLPSRKRGRPRRISHSSGSSLSSVTSLSSPGDSVDTLSPPSRPGVGEGRVAKAHDRDEPRPRPIKTRRKSLAPKQAVSNASGSISPTHPIHTIKTAVSDARMPGRVAASELFPNLSRKAARPTKDGGDPGRLHPQARRRESDGLGGGDGDVDDEHDNDEDEDAFWTRRREARVLTEGHDAVESSVRGRADKAAEPRSTPAQNIRKTRQSILASSGTRATRSASKRPIDDTDGASSPVSASFAADSGSAMGSRAATPTTLRPSKKPRSGLRTKSSPVKKKGGTAAGVPRSTGELSSSVANGAPKDQSADNDEYCSACGNTGDVVCCDGCPRSFHFECVDMAPSESLPDEWYCNECLVRKWPSRVPVHRGVFGSALNSLEKSIPRAFSLPKRVQNRFEGVRAGADGDYEDVTNNKLTRKKNGYEEVPDLFRQREDGQAVLCHLCQKPATEASPIIPCSVCALRWHLDCLDPPMAAPPALKTWRCPAHADETLAEAHRLAPAHRLRRIKGAQPIAPALTRGIKNNGLVEVDWPDETEEANASGWPDPQSFGRTYKLPAKSIILDFIEQLRNQGAGYGSRQDEPRAAPYLAPASLSSQATLRGSDLERKLTEVQLSLNLTSLRRTPSGAIGQLTSALLAGADENILALLAQTSAESIISGELADTDKQGLRLLLAQMDAMSSRIRQVLAEDIKPPCTSQPGSPASRQTTPAFNKLGQAQDEKLEASEPVTEPTPPSTVDQAEGSMDVD